jgi:hypothetical protein
MVMKARDERFVRIPYLKLNYSLTPLERHLTTIEVDMVVNRIFVYLRINPLRPKRIQTLFTDSARTSKETRLYITRVIWLKLFRENYRFFRG